MPGFFNIISTIIPLLYISDEGGRDMHQVFCTIYRQYSYSKDCYALHVESSVYNMQYCCCMVQDACHQPDGCSEVRTEWQWCSSILSRSSKCCAIRGGTKLFFYQ